LKALDSDPAANDGLRLQLLGGISITLGGAPMRGFLSSKVQALLCYLAYTGRSHARESLMSLLWGDMPEERAAHGLRQALSNLQKLAGPYLQVTRQSVAFNRDAPYYLDTEIFQDLLKQANTAALGRRRRLREALELYAGDFLEGFYVREAPDFEEWAAGQRERLRQDVLDALHVLATHHTGRGEYGQAADYLRRLLALDPWREDAHRQLMLLLAYMGQPDAAAAQYRTVRQVLLRDLGEEPAEETTALYTRIREGEVEARPPEAPPGNLHRYPQAQYAPLVGRRAELAQVKAQLEDAACRILTLAGPGGVGKTRLAQQVALDLADEFAHGAYFVPLASVGDPALVLSTVARTLGVEESPGRSLQSTLAAALQHREVLLLLDNFEHLMPAAPLLAELRDAAPQLRLLVTSRVRLHLRGERVYQLQPLAVPPVEDPALPEVVSLSPAVAMFTERAVQSRPGFGVNDANAGTVAEICRRLEGFPLAIELAAARLQMMPPQALLARLESRLGVLTGGARDAPARHRTMRATIEWSYSLLPEPERRLFGLLSVFAGGCTLEAVEALATPGVGGWGLEVGEPLPEAGGLESEIATGTKPPTPNSQPPTPDEVLTTLVDNHLVHREQAEAEGEARFQMLELVREYAQERLADTGEEAQARQRHAEYYLGMAAGAGDELRGPRQHAWLDRLETEHGNLRAALKWGMGGAGADGDGRRTTDDGRQTTEERRRKRVRVVRRPWSVVPEQGDLELALQACGVLWRFWDKRGYLTEGRRWLEGLLARPGSVEPATRAEALRGAGILAFRQGDLERAAELCEDSLQIYTELGDVMGSASAYNSLGNTRREQGDHKQARTLYEHGLALYRQIGDRLGVAVVLSNLGATAQRLGDPAGAAGLYEESLLTRREMGDSWGVAYTLDKLGEVARDLGDLDRAAALCQESLAMRRELKDKHGTAMVLTTLGTIERDRRQYSQAGDLFDSSLAIYRELGEIWGIATALRGLGSVAHRRGEHDRAAHLYGESLELYRENGDRRAVAMLLSDLAELARQQGDRDRAQLLIEESRELHRQLG
jgi:predicted ATPase/DNA-binding SARP family transcriptional activator